MSKQTIHSIGIIGSNTGGAKHTILALLAYLRADNELTIYLEQALSNVLACPDLPTLERAALPDHCQLIIVVGGDGSMLSVARSLAHQQIPTIGINTGNVGFLTDINPEHLADIGPILAGEFKLEPRLLIQAACTNPHIKPLPLPDITALNEIAVLPTSSPKLIEFTIHINDRLLARHRADGVIIATPTGSTAYALAAGGPVVHPDLDALLIIPLLSQNLNVRPIVISSSNSIKITLLKPQQTAKLVHDGQEQHDLAPETVITVSSYPYRLHLLHPLSYDYYATLTTKLKWSF